MIYRKCYFGHRDKFRGHRYCTGTTGRVPGVHRVGPPAPGATWAVGGVPWPIWAKGTSPKRPMRQEIRKGRVPKGEGTS